MTRILSAISLAAFVVLLVVIAGLALLESGGPARQELRLEGRVPATLFLPWPSEGFRTEKPADVEPPPAVVLAHGFASDRVGMSGLARALTQAGYAVLTIDLRGHGENREPFVRSGGQEGSLFADLRTAVEFLRSGADVDPARISVAGHSMGAGVTLEYAGFDPALDAAVMISGGWRADGPQRPANALFLYASGDPDRIREGAARLVAQLAGVESAPPGEVFGDFDEGTAVAHEQVAGVDHITILSSQIAARRIIDWLDRSYGVERGTFFLRSDPRLPLAGVGLLALVVLLPGLGSLLGRLATRVAERPGDGAAGRLGLLAAALLVTLPFVAVGGLDRVVPLVVAGTVATHLFAAGSGLLAFLALRGRFDGASLRTGLGAAVAAAAVGTVAAAFLLAPLAVVLHGLGLTPERALAAGVLIVLIAPFQLAFHDLLRRGSTAAATIASSLGRLLILAVLVLAVQVGVLSGVVMLMLPVLAGLFVLFELLSTGIYARSRSHLVPALVETGWLAWVLAAVMPVTF